MTQKSELIGADSLVRVLLDAVPVPVFLIDQTVRILDCNTAAVDMLKGRRRAATRHRYGDILQCLQGMKTGKPCVHLADCAPCPVRQTITAALDGRNIVRQKLLSPSELRDKDSGVYLTANRVRIAGQPVVMLAVECLDETAGLRRLIPICASCRRIRGYDNAWHRLESYLTQNHYLNFTHGLCPECLKVSLAEVQK